MNAISDAEGSVSKPGIGDYETGTAEPGYVFALVDMHRTTKNKEYLRFAEHIGRNILEYRQHPENGLFTLEDSRIIFPGIYERGSKLNEGHERKAVCQLLGRKHRTASLDVQEPLALLSIYAAGTGHFDKIPMWVCGGLYAGGRAFSSGHIVSHEFELWYDKPALEQWYKERNVQYNQDYLYPEDEDKGF